MKQKNEHFTMSVHRQVSHIDYSYQAKKNRLKALKITEHLKNSHGIEVPENFSEQLLTAHQESYISSFSIPLSTIDAIVDACELFEEYVLDISQLVCFEVLTMARIHTCIISKSTLAQNMIPVKKIFSDSCQAIVRKNGSVTVTAERS